MFYTGINTNITQPIHRFHQYIFYIPNSTNFRSQWDFDSRNDFDKQGLIFLNAISIRNTDVMSSKSEFLKYDDLMCPELKNAVIQRDDLYNIILNGIISKYNIQPVSNEPEAWNNLGDLIQFYCILFYETCLHAIVLDNIKVKNEQSN
jgi:hypothetical protein